MKPLERIELVDKIGRDLQARMKWGDVTQYLAATGINTKKEYSGTNSKWVYVKEMLVGEPDELILKIANELGIDATQTTVESKSKFWIPGYFRLFISHLSTFKIQASQLQSALKEYGISAFVAHEDIEPTREWLTEIETALFSMDALAALLVSGFHASNWTDHEIGVAIGRDKLVIPVKRDLDPYGLFGKYQALNAKGLRASEVAKSLFMILNEHRKTKSKFLDCLSELFLLSSSASDAKHWHSIIALTEDLPQRLVENLYQNVPQNSVIVSDPEILADLNKRFVAAGLGSIKAGSSDASFTEDDIPF